MKKKIQITKDYIKKKFPQKLVFLIYLKVIYFYIKKKINKDMHNMPNIQRLGFVPFVLW
jgi:hypothetical protein